MFSYNFVYFYIDGCPYCDKMHNLVDNDSISSKNNCVAKPMKQKFKLIVARIFNIDASNVTFPFVFFSDDKSDIDDICKNESFLTLCDFLKENISNIDENKIIDDLVGFFKKSNLIYLGGYSESLNKIKS